MRNLITLSRPIIILFIVVVFFYTIEYFLIDQIITAFRLEDIDTINIFNKYFLYLLGILTFYILSKYTMEMNERIFRVFTFVLNLFGIIVIISVVIGTGFLELK